MKAYCMRDGIAVVMEAAEEFRLKNGKPAWRGACPICGGKIYRIGWASPGDREGLARHTWVRLGAEFWRWLVSLPWGNAMYFESAEGEQTWRPNPADLPTLVKRIEEVQKTGAYREALREG